MKYLTTVVLLIELCSVTWALNAPGNYGQQQQLVQENLIQQNLIHYNILQQNLLQQNLIQQQIQKLQQQLYVLQQRHIQDQFNRASNLNIDDFEYVPTVQGYRYSYKLPDAARLEENAYITGFQMDGNSRLDSKTTPVMPVDVESRFRMNLKNRKLSPGSLRALAG